MAQAASLAAAEVAVVDATPDDHVDGVPVRLVARPTSTEQVAAALRAASADDLAVVVRGNGTKLGWGAPPRRADLLLDLSGLNRLGEHAAGDLVVTAQAGVRLNDLQSQVGAEGQRLLLDETVAGSTIGGVIATSPSGPRRVLAGTVRDLLIGVTVVRADGVVARSGGKVVKNVAGYDLGKLMTGSYGTLAVVTEATFRLHPIPAAGRWTTAPVPDATAAARMLAAVIGSQLVPAAVEVDWPADGSGTLAVLVEGTAAGVDARSAAVAELLGPQASHRDDAEGWGHAYPWAVDDGGTRLKITSRLSGVAEVLAAVRASARRHQTAIPLRGSGGAGVLYAAVPADCPADAVADIVSRLRDRCGRLGGSVVVLDAPAEVKRAVDVWGPVHGLGLMRRVKQEFDPHDRLAPGRFVGGI